MGGIVAQKFCDLYPDRLKALVLSATAHTFNHSGPEWQENFIKTRAGPLTQGRKISEYAPDLLKTMMGPGTGGPEVDHVLYNIKQMSAEGFQAAIKAISPWPERRFARMTLHRIMEEVAAAAGLTAKDIQFDPESMTSLEAGMRATSADGRHPTAGRHEI